MYYIQAVNTSIGIFNKTTSVLEAGFTFNSFFNGAGSLCDSYNQGDPIVVYDPLTDRWLISDFAFTTDSNNKPVPPYYQCIAVSITNDPLTGGWYRYAYSFRFPSCTGATTVVSGTVTDALLGSPLSATLNISGYAGGYVSTNPATGFYSVTLLPGTAYTFSVTALVSGYNVTTRTIGPLSSNSTQSFALTADTAVCNAPGYAFIGGVSENFDTTPAPTLPPAWAATVVTLTAGATITPVWFLNAGTLHPSGNPSHSAPNLVLFNSFSATTGNSARLARRGPIDMTSVGNTDLTLWMYHDAGYKNSDDNVQVQVSTDGGASWADVGAPLSRLEKPYGWQQHTISLAAYGSARKLLLGFVGNSAWGNDINLDDIALGSPAGCSPPGFYPRAFIPIVLQ